MKNLYSVGEPVILQSKYFPQENGEYIVESFVYEKVGECMVTGDILPGGFVYKLQGSIIFWDESALRKKHQPSSESFKDMMHSLNSKIVEEV